MSIRPLIVAHHPAGSFLALPWMNNNSNLKVLDRFLIPLQGTKTWNSTWRYASLQPYGEDFIINR